MDWPALLDVTLEWLDMNKDWLFQGAGVVVVVGLLGWLSSPGKPDHRIRRLPPTSSSPKGHRISSSAGTSMS